MAGKFKWEKFNNVNLNDSFFDSLKNDYPEFTEWFHKKSRMGEETLVYNDDLGIGAFLYLKDEEEPLELSNITLPARKRVKIGTLRLAERQRGIRLGEGAVGVALWKWRDKQVDEIYVTIFEKHTELIRLFERFGFKKIGNNKRGEFVYIKNRKNIDYSNPYTAFPFIRPDFKKAGVIPISEDFHDKLFPYSELMGNNKQIEEITAGNGITKIYIGTPYTPMHYEIGEPVGIYRKYGGASGATYKSVITSYATITRIVSIKKNERFLYTLSDFLKEAGNKSVFSDAELISLYNSNSSNIDMIEMVYNGFFGKGHNINHKKLSSYGLFPNHPYKIDYTKEQFIKILEMGDADVQNIIID